LSFFLNDWLVCIANLSAHVEPIRGPHIEVVAGQKVQLSFRKRYTRIAGPVNRDRGIEPLLLVQRGPGGPCHVSWPAPQQKAHRGFEAPGSAGSAKGQITKPAPRGHHCTRGWEGRVGGGQSGLRIPVSRTVLRDNRGRVRAVGLGDDACLPPGPDLGRQQVGRHGSTAKAGGGMPAKSVSRAEIRDMRPVARRAFVLLLVPIEGTASFVRPLQLVTHGVPPLTRSARTGRAPPPGRFPPSRYRKGSAASTSLDRLRPKGILERGIDRRCRADEFARTARPRGPFGRSVATFFSKRQACGSWPVCRPQD